MLLFIRIHRIEKKINRMWRKKKIKMIEMTYLLGFCHALDNQFESAPNVDSISFGPCIAPLETIERNASLKWNEWRHLSVCACTGNALNMSEWCSQTVKVNVIKRALSVHAERQVAWINRGSFIHFYHDKNMCDTYSLNTVNLHSHTHTYAYTGVRSVRQRAATKK